MPFRSSSKREEKKLMIDDDTFEKLFRDLIEDFLRRAGIGHSESFFDSQEGDSQIATDEGVLRIDTPGRPVMERVDFDDYCLIVIEGCMDKSGIVAKAKGNQLLLEVENGEELLQEMPFIIDAEKSIISCQNGVAEITVTKSDVEESDEIMRLLRYA